MTSIDLNVTKRERRVRPATLRRDGKIPGVYYGGGQEAICVSVDAKEFRLSGLRAQGAHLIRLCSSDPGLDKGLALLKEIQRHPVKGHPTHIDFYKVDMSKPVHAEIPLNFVGKAAGVVEGGMLQPIRRVLEVKALPGSLPEEIEIDVTELAIHDSIHVEDIAMPDGVEAVFHENFTVVTLVPPVVEAADDEEETEAEVAPVAEADTPAAE